MNAPRTRLIEPHTDHHMPEGWDHCWWLTDQAEYRDILGRKNGSGRRWLVMACNLSNHIPCQARALVLEDDLLTLAVDSLDEGAS